MEQSSIYQMIIERGVERGREQGIEQGAKRNAIESIVALLQHRFQVTSTPDLNQQLQTIDDLQQLKDLFQHAIETQNLDNFLQVLQTYQSGK